MITAFPLPPQETNWTFKPILELRYRDEWRNNRDFNGDKDDNKRDDYYRWRVGVTGKSKDGKEFTIRYLGGTDEAYVAGTHTTIRNSDLDLAYFKFADHGVTYTAGRQGMRLGEGRIVGALFDWGNTTRTFDGVRAQTKQWEAFLMRIGTCNPYSGEAKLGGASLNTKAGATSVFFKHDSKMPSMTDVWVLDHLYKNKRGLVDYNLEATGESGRVVNKDLKAWALAANVGLQSGKGHYFLEGAFASGGSNRNTSYTFDQIYSTNQLPSGMLLMQGYRNVHRLTLGVDYNFDRKTSVCASLNSVALHDASDAWYGGFGTPNMGTHGAFVDPTGKSGKDVGRYVQVELQYNLSDHDLIWVGAGAFVPGQFVNRLNGGEIKTQSWGFVSYRYKF